MAARAAQNSLRATLRKNWYSPEVLPIFAVVGVAVGGCGWYLARLARGPDVVWDRRGNPRPWEHIKPDQNTKLYAIKPHLAISPLCVLRLSHRKSQLR
ncbi:uncharacterized protein L969DRAFT_105566 [Mixia osmundae IAM 14324]|uniref:NADH dehydrogenase [ubiquinone] 1 alpha subcomplex subunit 4 n=1 Tax=Mixia osmundae (strain CBS 9802 / IAM 14324 / JCM 22182 / KY 12970) TaxID=764103 RepID=G7E2E0_MIXOS|nr:uncharacterized protein L969DRAFT_105566 [Mixia osmundae IAM 14324]KEI36871.1 hypothetical protein L969DRAFT_105566 [Mixia osmundae IAM 14324]GAA97000.1 hypothetical protein E5Q_03674 [Mixia osmundae IAM 14324]